jgi:hypothetical protein
LTDAVERYCAASAAADIEGVMATLTEDAEVVSPLVGRMVFRGERDLRRLLGTIYRALDGFHWDEHIGAGATRVVIGEGRIMGARLGDAMAFDLAPDGRIRRVRPHLRPWLGLTVFALRIGPALALRPGIFVRALRG